MTAASPPPLVEILTRLIGPPVARRGDHSGRPWWRCPLHPDRNPSFTVVPGKGRWKCFGCGATGDGIDLARHLNPGIGFREAVALAGGSLATRPRPVPGRPVAPRSRVSNQPEPPTRPVGWHEFIRGVVDEAEAYLWSEAGAKALRYLRERGLKDETIRAARLGSWLADTYRGGLYDKRLCVPRGIVIPWHEREVVEAVNVRRPVPSRPDGAAGAGPQERKYHLIRGSRRMIYPGRGAIIPGRPLILAEGELDALLLGQELAGLATVVTLGSASDRRPDPAILLAMSTASPWYVAADADGAGSKASDDWMARSGRCRRVLVPEPSKDWTEAFQDGIELRPWWGEVLAGRPVEEFDPAWYEATEPAFEGTIPDPDGIESKANSWRWEVANWPHQTWFRWRRRAGELLSALVNPTAEEIRAAEHAAYRGIAT